MTDSHSPRKNDHLVEPFYAGLGAEEEPKVQSSRTGRWVAAVLITALVLWLLFGSG